ncbi:MAG: hypothetical protein JWN01_1120 [Patescibacteria group bacterium]|nr:hypothetical protein [Patescibacteria group bacterium]
MNLKLDLNLKKILPMLRQLEPYVFGAALIAIFGYTALVVNGALNVKPAANSALTPAKLAEKITFDKKTIETVKNLQVVQGNVPTGDLGKDDPFK